MGRLRIVAAAILLAATLLTKPAGATSSCGQKVLDDWSQGDLSAKYAPDCYAEALANLPADVETYSSAPDDINRARRAAVQRERPTRTLQAARPSSSGHGPLVPLLVAGGGLVLVAGAFAAFRRFRV